jgi:hypothetical protein
MSKFCCFFCPEKDYTEKNLTDCCPKCGREYGFVLAKLPNEIRDYNITAELGRGFYGAAYIAEKGPFKRKYVIKISPTEFYSFFGKTSFKTETELHARLAENAHHVIGIEDRFDDNVIFADGSTVYCHITVLDYVSGRLLRDYIDGIIEPNAAAICQIAIDLLRVRSEFEANELNHNDLHSENLIVEELPPHARRQNAIDDSIRVKAIDLGSISDESKSGNERHGDLLFIARHVDQLLDRLLSNPSKLDDRDFRASLALQAITNSLLTDAQNIRHPNPNDLITQIQDAYFRAAQPWRPWNEPLRLKGFGDHYNAQTLVSWDVPRLLVDPKGRWLTEVTKPGPQIITGMRGCGKTMLLRALDIHARASISEGETTSDAISRIKNDGFIGLFVSAQRLLDLRQPTAKLEHRLTRLFVYYSLQACRALLHIRDLDDALVMPDAHSRLASVASRFIGGNDSFDDTSSIDDLEKRLERVAVMVTRGNSEHIVKQAPADVFQNLAESLTRCTTITSNSSVFFLLDDVSTRYLELDRVDEIISALLFQSPNCAFKFTSEWQTIELGLRSPGRIHPIREDRDIAVFDLGADVYETISSSGRGKGAEFVEEILKQRANFHVSHPKYSPRDLLGDVSLEQVAREIASSSSTSKQKKQAYRGISCLTSVCVGDIGDVIKLYEEIIKRASTTGSKFSAPIADSIQADCFQAISSRRIYDLNRRGGYYKNHALAFAQAAHDLMVRSYRAEKANKSKRPRLRQYSSLYVRVTTNDQESLKQQIDLLRELIDAGVFVYAGGAARTKTKDSNPMNQFKLSYRKIYGLAAFIGLSDRDRFELSGPALGQWLETPTKEILLRNQTQQPITDINQETEKEADSSKRHQSRKLPSQGTLFPEGIEIDYIPDPITTSTPTAKPIDVEIEEIEQSALSVLPIEGVLTGLGFEERTLFSNCLLSKNTLPKVVHGIKYDLSGHTSEIFKAWKSKGVDVTETSLNQLGLNLPSMTGLSLIDISGLSKPIIFTSIRRELLEKGRVIVCHVTADKKYPLPDDLKHITPTDQEDDPITFLENLGRVLKGEEGPYSDIKLLDEEVDLSRNRALLAFASPKHERLASLLDRREFDYIEIITPDNKDQRGIVANYAADFTCKNFQNCRMRNVGGKNLKDLTSFLDKQYLEIYSAAGANVELGLTGSKIQAVASAILSARRKVAQAWYLSPKRFDEKRFSIGVGKVNLYDVRIK